MGRNVTVGASALAGFGARRAGRPHASASSFRIRAASARCAARTDRGLGASAKDGEIERARSTKGIPPWKILPNRKRLISVSFPVPECLVAIGHARFEP
ncbi:MAG: hypothetical protein KY468_18910 [Armatimonadetes bacterium]|nr:hypothetical protein [Armatimonadota bacterium]